MVRSKINPEEAYTASSGHLGLSRNSAYESVATAGAAAPPVAPGILRVGAKRSVPTRLDRPTTRRYRSTRHRDPAPRHHGLCNPTNRGYAPNEYKILAAVSEVRAASIRSG